MGEYAISKILSSNDSGETGGHQAGILIQKQLEILKFFPSLPVKQKNPRAPLMFTDDKGAEWKFTFIYYNNSRFGGTRDEYRLTGMTEFIRKYGLKEGDTVSLTRDNDNKYFIHFEKKGKIAPTVYLEKTLGDYNKKPAGEPEQNAHDEMEKGVIKLGTKWRIISF